MPIGAVVVKDGAGHRCRTQCPARLHDPTAHAEVLAIRAAAKALGNERLDGCELWVTLEPCAMCAGAIAHARIGKLYYGAGDAKGGAVEHGARVFEQASACTGPRSIPGLARSEVGGLAARLLCRSGGG